MNDSDVLIKTNGVVSAVLGCIVGLITAVVMGLSAQGPYEDPPQVVYLPSPADGDRIEVTPQSSDPSDPSEPKEGGDLSTLRWYTLTDAARSESESLGRPVLVYFTRSDCLPCRAVERDVFTDPQVTDALSRFVLLRVDVQSPRGDETRGELWAKAFGIDQVATPSLCVLDSGVVRGGASGLLPAPTDPGKFLSTLKTTEALK